MQLMEPMTQNINDDNMLRGEIKRSGPKKIGK